MLNIKCPPTKQAKSQWQQWQVTNSLHPAITEYHIITQTKSSHPSKLRTRQGVPQLNHNSPNLIHTLFTFDAFIMQRDSFAHHL